MYTMSQIHRHFDSTSSRRAKGVGHVVESHQLVFRRDDILRIQLQSRLLSRLLQSMWKLLDLAQRLGA